MTRSARFEGNIDFCLANRDIVKQPLMDDFDDITPQAADDLGHLGQFARPVLDRNPDSDEMAVAGKAAEQDC